MARRHSSPEDFQLVGMDSDPTPGDPDLIQGVVQRYNDIGDAAENALNLLQKDGVISQGRGSAMDKLKAKISDDLPDKLTKTKTSYHDAAQAYRDYMPRLREAQDTFDRAVDQARAAAPQANAQPQQLSASPTDAERSQACAAQDSIDAGKNELNAAKSLAEQAKTMREGAQRQAAEILDRAAGEAIPERNIFQKIADFFKDFPFVQIILAILIAVVAVFFPVVGALLAGGLFLFNQVIASQTGGIKAGDFVLGLLGIVPGGSLLKLGGKVLQLAPTALTGAFTKFVAQPITSVVRSVTESKVVGAALSNSFGKVTAEVTGKFAVNAALEAAAKAANHDKITAAGVLAGAAAGAVVGGAFAAGVGKIGKGGAGKFGDTSEPEAGDSLGKKAADQLGGFVEEGTVLGTKIGVGVAQGGDLDTVAAGEISNSASALGAGARGQHAAGRGVDSITDRLPTKGGPRPSLGPVGAPPAAPAGPSQPGQASPAVSGQSSPLPSSPTVPAAPVPLTTQGPALVDPASVPLPSSPTSSSPPASPVTSAPDVSPAASAPGTSSAVSTPDAAPKLSVPDAAPERSGSEGGGTGQ